MTDVHFMSEKQNWATPPELFEELHREFNFDIDVCAEAWNAKLPTFWTREDNCLFRSWKGLRCFMNPPYGREIKHFIEKASTSEAELVVALLPARTDTQYFHNYIYNKAEIRFIKGRVCFHSEAGPGSSAPFPSMIVIWRNNNGQ